MNIKGILPSYKENTNKFKIEITIKAKKQPKVYLIVGIVQNYSKDIFLINLNLFRISSQVNKFLGLSLSPSPKHFDLKTKNTQGQSFISTYRSSSYAIQQLYYLYLTSGKYICVFEAATQLKKDQPCCARIFMDKKLYFFQYIKSRLAPFKI